MPRAIVVFSVVAFVSIAPAAAQCSNVWLPGDGLCGVDGIVEVMKEWDPDGPGPATPLVVVGGSFAAAGSTKASRVALWDPASGTWSPLGGGLDDPFSSSYVQTAVVMPNGDLVVAGAFTTAGGSIAPGVARWDGGAWSPLGGGIYGQVRCLAVLPNGDLVAGGTFGSAGGVSTPRIARWDGTSWSGLGTGMNGFVDALAVLPNGDLLAGGTFTVAGSVPANYLARWDGTAWSALPGPSLNGGVRSLTVLANGDVLAGGSFTTPAAHIARWNGVAWAALGSGLNGDVLDLTVLPNGDLVPGGTFTTAGGVSANRIAQWNGSNWSALGSGTDSDVSAVLALANGDLVAGGYFRTAGGLNLASVARWSNGAWYRMGSGVNAGITSLRTMPNGDLVAAGAFTTIGGVNADRVARWDGVAWWPFGVGSGDSLAYPLAVGPSGDVFVARSVVVPAVPPYIPSSFSSTVARWNGASWTTLPGTFDNIVSVLAALPNGEVIAGGIFTALNGGTVYRIAKWNGVAWSAFGSSPAAGLHDRVLALAVMPNGDLIAGGAFQYQVRRWDGSVWAPLGTGMNGAVYALAPLPNGDLVAGGQFTMADGASANCVARWNGSTWSPLGTGFGPPGWPTTVTSLAVLPNGDIMAGGYFSTAGGVSVDKLARWNGSTWSPVGGGLDWYPSSIATLPNGDMVFGGEFRTAGGSFSANLATLSTTCPATSSVSGLGCPSSGGANALAATTLPWVDATFRATGTGLPTNALVLTLTSVTPVPQGVAPLSIVFPQAGLGCDVLAAPDILGLLVTATGTVQSDLFLPNTPPLVGVTFYHQMVPIEFDGLGNWVAVSATNALQLVAGMF